ncbi:MAG TPA: PKD domain-containing protein [Mycobacteriales bacterium]
MKSIRWAVGVAALVLACAGTLTWSGVVSVQATQTGEVQPVTPRIADGNVLALAQIGSVVLVGGSFRSAASPDESLTYHRDNLMAFDARTGAVDPGFAPVLDGAVSALLPSPDGRSVYAAGAFGTVNGEASRGLARLDLATGKAVPGFTAPVLDGDVNDVGMAGKRLYLGGDFTGGMMSLDPDTGAADPFFGLSFGGGGGAAGVTALDVAPDGGSLAAVGDFTSVGGASRTRVALIDLSGPSASVLPWSTDRYGARCAGESSVQDVAYAPDGTYFTVVTGGGTAPDTLCGTAARWDPARAARGPTWVARTGGDALQAVTVTGSAVYVGGRQRWLDNPAGEGTAGPGAVSRPGVAALDPRNGLPLSWSPPATRGAAARVLYPTATGLWVGADSSGGRNRLAFVPLVSALPADAVAALPNDVFAAGPLAPGANGDGLLYRHVDAARTPGTGPDVSLPVGGFEGVRGAFMTDDILWTGNADGTLRKRSFDGRTLGAVETVDLHGLTDFATELRDATGMFFDAGRLYYTRSGDSNLYYRYFTPESGVVGAERFTADVAGVDWDHVAGLTRAGDQVLWADDTGTLRAAPFRATGVATVLSGPAVDGRDWRARALFVRSAAAAGVSPLDVALGADCAALECRFTADASGRAADAAGAAGRSYRWDFGDGGTAATPQATHTYTAAGTYTVTLRATDGEGRSGSATRQVEVAPGRAPVAAFSADCTGRACRFDATSSTGSGPLETYTWDFGDGSTGTGAGAEHTFPADGTFPVRLTVTDAGGLTGTVGKDVVVESPTGAVAFRDVAPVAADDGGTTAHVTVPDTVRPGDSLLLFLTADPVADVTGWRQLDHSGTTAVYHRVAVAADAGSAVSLPAGAGGLLLAYAGTDGSDPQVTSASGTTTPSVDVAGPGAWVVSYWAGGSAGAAPQGLTSRGSAAGSLAADSGGPVPGGRYGGLDAAPADATAAFTVVINPQR